MKSIAIESGLIYLPTIEGEYPMIPFDLNNISSLPDKFISIAVKMLSNINHKGGIAYFTLHGKVLKKGETLRRGGGRT